MAMRFRRSMKIAPGVRVNLGKRGASLTVGGKAGRVTVGSSGTHVGSSIPGTGVYFSQKVGASGSRQAGSSSKPIRNAQSHAHGAGQMQEGTLMSLLRGLPPRESGTTGMFAALTSSPKRQALQTIRRASSAPSKKSDEAVSAAVNLAPESWTVRREAAIYFLGRKKAEVALSHMAEAANRFPGDRTMYYLVAADMAIDARNYDYARSALEPYVGSSDPNSDLGALVLATLANATLQTGDHSRALELLGRLPLRRQNLDDTLLYALCVRACANRAAGKKAQAKKDIDRVYARRPDFPLLQEAAATALAE